MQEAPEVGGRRHMRIGYDGGKITVRCVKAGPLITGNLVDISSSGCQIEFPEPLSIDNSEVIELRVNLSTIGFRVLGFVRRRTNGDRLIGVEFHRLSESDRADLDTFIEYFAPL